MKSHIFPVDGCEYDIVIDREYTYIFQTMYCKDHIIIRIRCHFILVLHILFEIFYKCRLSLQCTTIASHIVSNIINSLLNKGTLTDILNLFSFKWYSFCIIMNAIFNCG